MERERPAPKDSIIAPKSADIYVGSISDEFAHALIPKLDSLSYKSPEMPIRFIIDGYGGGLDAGLEIAQRILALPNPIVTEARSKCYSAEVLLFSCGQRRMAYPDSNFMLHQAQLPDFHYSGPLNEVGKKLRPIFERNKLFIQTIADNIGFDFKTLYRETKGENYFGIDRAVNYYGLVTDVLPQRRGKR